MRNKRRSRRARKDTPGCNVQQQRVRLGVFVCFLHNLIDPSHESTFFFFQKRQTTKEKKSDGCGMRRAFDGTAAWCSGVAQLSPPPLTPFTLPISRNASFDVYEKRCHAHVVAWCVWGESCPRPFFFNYRVQLRWLCHTGKEVQ